MPLLTWATILRLLRDFLILAQLYWFSNVLLCLLVVSDVTEVCIPPHGLSWTASTQLLTYDYHHHSVGHLFLIFKITSCPKVLHSFLSSSCKLVSGLPHPHPLWTLCCCIPRIACFVIASPLSPGFVLLDICRYSSGTHARDRESP